MFYQKKRNGIVHFIILRDSPQNSYGILRSVPFLKHFQFFAAKTVDFSSFCLTFSTLTPPFACNKHLQSVSFDFFFSLSGISSHYKLTALGFFCFSGSKWYDCEILKSQPISISSTSKISQKVDDNYCYLLEYHYFYIAFDISTFEYKKYVTFIYQCILLCVIGIYCIYSAKKLYLLSSVTSYFSFNI